MNKVFLFLTVVLLFFVFWNRTQAINQSDVLINEIAWMGSTNSANDEWIELFNASSNQIDLSGWALKSADDPSVGSGQGKLTINLKGTIPAKGFYLLERTDNNSVPAVNADLIYKGALTNSGMDLRLYDNSNNLIDEGNYSMGWPAGDNITKQTMERIAAGWPASNASRSDAGWQTSKDQGGTPKTENSYGAVKKSPTNTVSLKTANEAITLPKSKKSDNNINVSSAGASQSIASPKNNLNQGDGKLSSWSLFLILLGTIISLAIIMLVVKIKLKK